VKFSIIMPMDEGRLEQFLHTKRVYDDFPETKEFIIPTRMYDKIYPFMKRNKLLKDVRFFPYTIGDNFNPTKALNIGVREARYDNLILTGPEVCPTTQILEQLSDCDIATICQTFDEDVNGELSSMVHKGHKDDTPWAYFLAMFPKAGVEAINGWDEDFMGGHAYEDNDFAERWVRAGLPFQIREDIQAVHQYHPRSESYPGAAAKNEALYLKNNAEGVIRPKNGLVKDV
jgi:hypothetical protein